MRLPWILRVVADEWDRRSRAWAQKKVEGWDTEYLPPKPDNRGHIIHDVFADDWDSPEDSIYDNLQGEDQP